MTAGKVYLVGAGPGDPGLITVKGAECLKIADVIVYDRLINPQLLALAPDSAQLIFMGKEPETSGDFQKQINETLCQAALDGKAVVRLKGGDPFVFGRGGEEVDTLQASGVPYEVVPGITSAVAVPAYSGIPVTHRGVATSFTVVAGSEDPAKAESDLDWPALAHTPGTLVVLMGWRTLPRIIDTLIEHGRSPETPVAITQWGTTSKQRSVSGTLANIVVRGAEAGISAPVVTVIGEVAALSERFRWFETGPLFGSRVLVTRSRQQASTLSKLLLGQGAEPVELATIEIQPLGDFSKLDSKLARLDSYAWVVFTSTNAVAVVFERLAATNQDARAFGAVRIGAVGPATAKALAERGILANLVLSTYTTAAIAKDFATFDMKDARILLPRADIATTTLSNGLRELGGALDEVHAYHTVTPASAPARAKELLTTSAVDIATFTSSSTVRNLVKLLGGDLALLDRVRIVAIGPVTSNTAHELGLRVDVEATEHTVRGMVEAMVKDATNSKTGVAS